MARKSENKSKKANNKPATPVVANTVVNTVAPVAAKPVEAVAAPLPQVAAAPAPVEQAPASTPVATTQAAVVVRESPARMITRQQVAQRAYEIFRAREGRNGTALGDWVQAERELGLI